MEEPSEEVLDRHYRTQCMNYDFTHKRRASASDQILIGNWLRIFGKVPKEQKVARNSLMLLMYGHLKEFGYLQVPFIDEQNYVKNLNELVDSYAGLSMSSETVLKANGKNKSNSKSKTPTMEQQIRYILRNSVKQRNPPAQVNKREKNQRKEGQLYKISTLQPIKEISETSDLEPTTSHNTLVTVIPKNKDQEHLRDITYDSHRCYKVPEKQQQQSLVEDVKKMLSNKTDELVGDIKPKSLTKETKRKVSTLMECPTCQLKREMDIPATETVKRTSPINLVNDTIQARNSSQQAIIGREKIMAKEMEKSSTETENSSKCIPKAVRNLKVCFDKIIETDLEREQQQQQQTRVNKGISSLPPQIVVHQEMGTGITERLRQLRERNEELRLICLKYYNMDGSLKPIHLSKIKAKRTRGFLIGAQRALKRLQRWHGLPHRLGFFATCFKYTGIGLGPWRWRAIDRNLEKVTHKWFRNTLQQSQQHAWRSYRELMLNQNMPKTAETLRLLNQILNSRRELILERMSHLQQLKQLFIQECEGKINAIQLQKMLKHLENKCHQLSEDLHLLACQQQQQQQLKLKSK